MTKTVLVCLHGGAWISVISIIQSLRFLSYVLKFQAPISQAWVTFFTSEISAVSQKRRCFSVQSMVKILSSSAILISVEPNPHPLSNIRFLNPEEFETMGEWCWHFRTAKHSQNLPLIRTMHAVKTVSSLNHDGGECSAGRVYSLNFENKLSIKNQLSGKSRQNYCRLE